MIKIKEIFIICLFAIIFSAKTNAEIKDSLYITVGNRAITKIDIVNEIKVILILNNMSYSEEKREELQKMAVKSTIERTIKEIEIKKNNFLEFNQKDLNIELERLASRINMNVETLRTVCESNELDFSMIKNQIKTELLWNSLIFLLYKNRLQVNNKEIEERLKIIQNKEEVREYLISEILLNFSDKDNLEEETKKLINKIGIEGFESVAKNSSIAESSKYGGDLGWLNENIISKKLKVAITNTAIGSLSEPIMLPEGILIFKIRDIRKIKNNKSLEEIKNEIVKSEKLKILTMHSLSHYDKLRRSVSVKFYK